MNAYVVRQWERTKEIAMACDVTWALGASIEFYDKHGLCLGHVQTVAEAHAFLCGYEHCRSVSTAASDGIPSAQVPCSVCGGTGQSDPPPGKYHGLCLACNGTGKQNKQASCKADIGTLGIFRELGGFSAPGMMAMHHYKLEAIRRLRDTGVGLDIVAVLRRIRADAGMSLPQAIDKLYSGLAVAGLLGDGTLRSGGVQ